MHKRWWDRIDIVVEKPLTPRRFYLCMHPYEVTQADIAAGTWELCWVLWELEVTYRLALLESRSAQCFTMPDASSSATA